MYRVLLLLILILPLHSVAADEWERIYPNEVYIKQTGLFQRTITWNQRSDAARVVIEAWSWAKPHVDEYPYRYYVAEVVTGRPGRYSFVQRFPVRPDIFVGYYLTEYRYLHTDEPWYGYGVYWIEAARFAYVPLVRVACGDETAYPPPDGCS